MIVLIPSDLIASPELLYPEIKGTVPFVHDSPTTTRHLVVAFLYCCYPSRQSHRSLMALAGRRFRLQCSHGLLLVLRVSST
jgi:hypothetical protein